MVKKVFTNNLNNIILIFNKYNEVKIMTVEELNYWRYGNRMKYLKNLQI